MNILDIGLIVVALIVAIIGLCKGFNKCLMGFLFALVSFIAAIVVSGVLYTNVIHGENPIAFIVGIEESISGGLTGSLEGGNELFAVAATSVEDINNAVAASSISFIGFLNLGNIIMAWAAGTSGLTVAGVIGAKVGSFVVKLVIGIILYIIFRILLSLFNKLLRLALKDPIVKIFDKVLGIAWTVLILYVIVSVLLSLLHAFGPTVPQLEGVIQYIEASKIGSSLYANSPFNSIFGGIAG